MVVYIQNKINAIQHKYIPDRTVRDIVQSIGNM